MNSLQAIVFIVHVLCASSWQPPAAVEMTPGWDRMVPISAGDEQVYVFHMEAGWFGRLQVQQYSVRVAAFLYDPDGGVVARKAPFEGYKDSLMFAFMAERTGMFRLVIQPLAFFDPDDDLNSFNEYTQTTGTYRLRFLDAMSYVMHAAHKQARRQDPRVAWLREHARPIKTLDPDETDFSDLQHLKLSIAGARIVMLGEPGHRDGSSFLAKARLIKFLHQEMGFEVLAMESGLFDSDDLWRRIEKAEASLSDWQDALYNHWPFALEYAHTIDYVQSMSQIATPLILTGFALNAKTSGFPLQLRAFLEDHQIGLTVDDTWFYTLVANTGAGAYHFEQKTLDPLSRACFLEEIARIVAEVHRLAENNPTETLFLWKRYIDAFHLFAQRYTYSKSNKLSIRPPSERDIAMGKNMLWLAKERFPDKKIIVWAATFHNMRNHHLIKWPHTGASWSQIRSMADVVYEEMGSQLYSLAIFGGKGSQGWFSYQPTLEASWLTHVYHTDQRPELEFEEMMDDAGFDKAFVDLRNPGPGGEWLHQPFYAHPTNWAMKSEWHRMLDGFLYLETSYPKHFIFD